MGIAHVHCIVSGQQAMSIQVMARSHGRVGIRSLLWCEIIYKDHVFPRAIVFSVNSSHSEQLQHFLPTLPRLYLVICLEFISPRHIAIGMGVFPVLRYENTPMTASIRWFTSAWNRPIMFVYTLFRSHVFAMMWRRLMAEFEGHDVHRAQGTVLSLLCLWERFHTCIT